MTDNGLRAALEAARHQITHGGLYLSPATCDKLLSGIDDIERAALATATPSLDDAWRKAEERLPHLGDRRKSWRLVLTSNGKGTYGAEALPPLMPYHDWMDAKVEAYEDSPAAALLALAERLTEEAPDGR